MFQTTLTLFDTVPNGACQEAIRFAFCHIAIDAMCRDAHSGRPVWLIQGRVSKDGLSDILATVNSDRIAHLLVSKCA